MVMSAENRALCYLYSFPPPGSETDTKMKWSQIARMVWNVDGKTHPTSNGVKNAVLSWRAVREQRGRKVGWRKTTPAEDQKISNSFHKLRRPLCRLVTSRMVTQDLPATLQKKVTKRTVRNRLLEEGFKLEKT